MHPRVFFEGDLVLVYNQDKDAFGAGKFKPMWYGHFIIMFTVLDLPTCQWDLPGKKPQLDLIPFFVGVPTVGHKAMP